MNVNNPQEAARTYEAELDKLEAELDKLRDQSKMIERESWTCLLRIGALRLMVSIMKDAGE